MGEVPYLVFELLAKELIGLAVSRRHVHMYPCIYYLLSIYYYVVPEYQFE